MGRFANTPPEMELPRADAHAGDNPANAMAPEFPGAPEGLPLIPVEEISARLSEHLPDEAEDHLPDDFLF